MLEESDRSSNGGNLSQMPSDAQREERETAPAGMPQAYEPPAIETLGSVADLTLAIKHKRTGDFGNYKLS